MNLQSALVRNTLLTLFYRNKEEELEQHFPDVLTLLSYSQLGMEEGFKCIESLHNEKLRIRVWVDMQWEGIYSTSEIAAKTGIDDIHWITPTARPLNVKYSHLFLPILPISLVSKIIQFDHEHPFSCLIVDALLSGRRVGGIPIAADPFHPAWARAGYSNGSSILKQDLRLNLVKLKGYGFTFMEPHELVKWIIRNSSHTDKGELISQDVVTRAHQDGMTCLNIGPRTIITPLARDLAKQLGIEFVRNS